MGDSELVMALIFVTGISGAGKSAVRDELGRRGAQAYDTDEHAIAQWTNKVTGEITPLLADAHRTPQFLAQNDRRADPERVRQLAKEGEEQRVFLCGSIGNEDEVRPFFEKVFLLSIDEATMRHRLLARTAHDFGTKPHELELMLAWNEAIDEHQIGGGESTCSAVRSELPCGRECPPLWPCRDASGRRCVDGVDRCVRRFPFHHCPRRRHFDDKHRGVACRVGEEGCAAGASDSFDPVDDHGRGSRARHERAKDDRVGWLRRSRGRRRRRGTGHSSESAASDDDPGDEQAAYNDDDGQAVRSVATHRPERYARRHACTAGRRGSVGA
jgi:hypothetical protein